ncbi:MAG: copper chaperone PCu(A)C [Bacteriovoracaceae bacterium]
MKKIFLLITLSFFSLPTLAETTKLELLNGRVRNIPPTAPMSAAYGTLKNNGMSKIKILSGSSNCSKTVELHETRESEGVMQMRKVKHYLIMAKGRLDLKPGGKHIMLIGLNETFKSQKTCKITLQSESESFSFELPKR